MKFGRAIRRRFDYEGEDDDELSFQEGDTIIVVDDSHEEWWRGTVGGKGKEGLFPMNYVEKA